MNKNNIPAEKTAADVTGITNQLMKQKKTITEKVLSRVQQLEKNGGLVVPSDYAPENALNAAYLTLLETEDKNHRPAQEVCTKESVANALLDMVIQGLTPAKNQCYFVIYGKKLKLMSSYMGKIAVAKRYSDVKDVFAQVVYEGDQFEYEIDSIYGIKRITLHRQSIANVDGKILAAYATVIRSGDALPYQEIMTMEEIKKAWGQGATKGLSPAHKNFPQEMAKKTVINRALKIFINSSSDEPILSGAYNRTTGNEYANNADPGIAFDEVDFKVEEDELPKEVKTESQVDQLDMNTISDSKNRLTEEEKAYITAQEEGEEETDMQGLEF